MTNARFANYTIEELNRVVAEYDPATAADKFRAPQAIAEIKAEIARRGPPPKTTAKSKGTWIGYARVRGEYIEEIRRIRALDPSHRDYRYLPTCRLGLAEARRMHYKPSRRQRRYNLQEAAGL